MEGISNPFSRQMKTPTKQSRPLKTQNLTPATVHGGLLNIPPPSVSYYGHQRQPPLLPLPLPPSRVCNKYRDHSLTPKKLKTNKRNRDSGLRDKKSPTEAAAEFVIVDSTNRVGPEPSHLPQDVSRFLSPPSKRSSGGIVEMEFSGSVFSVSPPPSSVPLPKFSLRPKLGCSVEAMAGIDTCATDNLRRLLRLR